MTLNELKIVKDALEKGLLPDESNAIEYIKREIKLKETDFIRMRDTQGNPIPNEGE